MQPKIIRIAILPIAMLAAGVACARTDQLIQNVTDEIIQRAIEEVGLPIPTEGVSNVTVAENTVSFDVAADFDSLVEFFRAGSAGQGLSEQAGSTVVTDTTATMTFEDASTSGSVTIQMVDIGDGMIKVTMSYQEN